MLPLSCCSLVAVFFVDAPRDIKIFPDPDAVEGGILHLHVGDHVNCTSKGNPEPEYLW